MAMIRSARGGENFMRLLLPRWLMLAHRDRDATSIMWIITLCYWG